MYRKQYFLIMITFIFFMILSMFLTFEKELGIDIFVYNLIKPFICPTLTKFFKYVTWFGSAIGILIFTAVFLVLLKDNRYKIAMLLNLIGSVLLNQGLKFFFMRERPKDIFLVEETGFSFPSGHSSVALAFYGFLIYLVWTRFQNIKLKITLIVILLSLIILIGISRIYLGVHYFSDVLGGYLITLAYLILFIIILDKKKFIPRFDNIK